MASVERTSKATEDVARTAGSSYGIFIDHARESLDRDLRFVRGWLGRVARETSAQSEANREAALRVIERTEKQRGALQTLAEESFEFYTDLLLAPLSYYGQGLRLVEDGGVVESFPDRRAAGSAFPIPGYDRMSVAGISGRLDGLSAGQIEEIRAYEKRNKNRESLIGQLDRRIKNAS